MNIPLSFEDLAAAEVCFAVASRLLYDEPCATEVAAQVVDRQFSDAPFAGDNEFERRGLALLDGWCVAVGGCADAPSATVEALIADSSFNDGVDELRREWLRLFVGLGAPEASCLESFYVEPNSHMFGKNTLAVRQAYRRHGLQVEKLHSEPDDHLGLMLGFLAYLMRAEGEAVAAADEAAADALADEQEQFLVDHVLPWLAAWRYAVGRHARTDYFRGVGDFVFGLVAHYAERFGIRFDEGAQAFKRAAR
ncbi:molecular chaperone TorD family protein [Adlercreutzia sp. R21]|uniref:TorD/DmsD family molecular chaperone n=1 Tax=Adlercreutzia wanghongyangiae TaxID=3111451 RepID=UPI002DBF9EA3|nr:molecular chaperone TorD family protein [Adlercreutzia sp. R21]MEC4184587.1 molecular chaperone TorD family protein [Adlercreutzia sp. R21]